VIAYIIDGFSFLTSTIAMKKSEPILNNMSLESFALPMQLDWPIAVAAQSQFCLTMARPAPCH
jgi:hypothetical protein